MGTVKAPQKGQTKGRTSRKPAPRAKGSARTTATARLVTRPPSTTKKSAPKASTKQKAARAPAEKTSARSPISAAEAPSRSEFIRKTLLENPGVSLPGIQQAWGDNGFPGTISPVLFYQVRSRMKKQPGRRGKRGSQPAPLGGRFKGQFDENLVGPKGKLSRRGEALFAIEEMLDSLIALTVELNEDEISELLRQARRKVSATLI